MNRSRGSAASEDARVSGVMLTLYAMFSARRKAQVRRAMRKGI